MSLEQILDILGCYTIGEAMAACDFLEAVACDDWLTPGADHTKLQEQIEWATATRAFLLTFYPQEVLV